MAKFFLIFVLLCVMGLSSALRCPVCTSDPNGDCWESKKSCMECSRGQTCIQGAIKSKKFPIKLCETL